MTNRWAEERWLYVDRLFNDGEFAEGRNVLESILAEDPGFGRAHSYLGWFYYTHLRDYRTAMNHLEMAIRFTPEYDVGYYHLVIVLMERRMYGRLIEVVNAALEVDGTDIEWMWEMRALALERVNRFGEARTAYINAIRESSNNENIVRYRTGITRVNRRERETRGWLAMLFL